MKTLIRNACILTSDSLRRVIRAGYVLIEGSRIASVGENAVAPTHGVDRVIDASGMVLTPGLINMHQHLHLHLLKGLADGLLLEPWVFTLTTPFRPHIDADALQYASGAGALEMLRTGTTCFLNHHGHFQIPDYVDIGMRAVRETGIRQLLALPFQCRTPKQPQHPLTAGEARQRMSAFVDLHRQRGDMLTQLGIVIECNAHQTELGRSSDELVSVGHELAHEKNLRIAAHVSGGTLSMKMGFTKYRRQTGRSDVEYLQQLGVLDSRWILKHGIHFSDADMEAVRDKGASVVYTPTSEAVRGGGFGPWRTMRQMGINCALGSDGPAVDYSVDMVEQMRAACYLQSVRYELPAAMQADDAFDMATISAARAMGWDSEIGSIEPGKQADLVLFDLRRPHQQLVENPLHRLVFTARGTDAHTVFVAGKAVLESARFVAVDETSELIQRFKASARAAVARADLNSRAQPVWRKPFLPSEGIQ